MTTHRITAIRVKDFKRLHEVAIRPDADRTIVLIGGKNANGKSSILDALSTALGGKKAQPADPVRHGADEASIVVELDGGDLEVRRTIQPDGESVLEVRNKMGALKAPQTMLDGLIGSRFLDPLQFLTLPAKEQRARLMTLIPGAERIAGLNTKRQAAFDRRTEIGRDLTRAQGELARLPDETPGVPIDVAQLNAKVRELADQQRAGDGLGLVVKQCAGEVRDAEHQIGLAQDRMRALAIEIARLQGLHAAAMRDEATWLEARATRVAARDAAQARLDAAAVVWQDSAAERARLDADLARADEHNRAVFAAEAQQRRRAQVGTDVAALDAERSRLTELLETIDARKAEILAGSTLPVPGLGISDDGLTLLDIDGVPVPFGQASMAQRWTVALALAIAASPTLRDVWIKDGAVVDEETIAALAAQAGASGHRLWIEVRSTSEPGTIVIRDGRVAGKTVRAAAETEPAP